MNHSPTTSTQHPALIAMRERIKDLYEWLVSTVVDRPSVPVHRFSSIVSEVRTVTISVAVITVFIFPIHLMITRTYPHASVNISFFYLVAIIWLAATVSRRASYLASALAFLVYDFLYTEPFFRLTITDPSQWISLLIFLLMSVVIGWFTAQLRLREQLTRQSQEQTALLYDLSQEIAANRQIDTLLPAMTQRICRTFAATGVYTCAAWLADTNGVFGIRAIDRSHDQGPPPLHLDTPSYQAQAEEAREHERVTQLTEGTMVTYFVPLHSGRGNQGVFSISGTPAISQLVQQSDTQANVSRLPAEQFTAICSQIALALERAQLQKEAIEVVILRESEQAKDTLLKSVTHDLRTPITAIQIAASSLQQTDIVINTADKEMLTEKIMGSSRRLASMVDNLLALAQTESGAALPPHVQYPINDVIATALDVLETAGQLQHNHVTITITEDPLEALMDHLAIERVVINLVENATKYAPPDSPIVISAQLIHETNTVMVQVHDHGIGIPHDQLQSIFVKFNRLQQQLPWLPAKDMPKGTGLGLTACAGIIHEHGGEIWAESRPGDGSTFTFTLPRHALPTGKHND